MTRTLSHAEARAFYDRFGARQDRQAFYEDPAIEELIRHAGFGQALRVVEFGCGTGRLARRLLERELPSECRYVGVDASETMVSLASSRLAPYRERASVRLSEGEVALPADAGSTDRAVSTYVADLLSDADTDRLVAEARRVLRPEGRLCLVGLTTGRTLPGRLVSAAWSAVHALAPRLVGGCRPVRLAPRLARDGWQVGHASVVEAWAVPSEVLVAAPPSSQ